MAITCQEEQPATFAQAVAARDDEREKHNVALALLVILLVCLFLSVPDLGPRVCGEFPIRTRSGSSLLGTKKCTVDEK